MPSRSTQLFMSLQQTEVIKYHALNRFSHIGYSYPSKNATDLAQGLTLLPVSGYYEYNTKKSSAKTLDPISPCVLYGYRILFSNNNQVGHLCYLCYLCYLLVGHRYHILVQNIIGNCTLRGSARTIDYKTDLL